MTERLYFEDAYLKEFDGRVLERFVREGRPAVVLDRTCFYPESGGQPSDRGTLGGADVLQVVEDGEKIIHLLDLELSGAEAVRGEIDWARRFDHMQQHSGQHILSQCFVEILEGETRSFHMGDQVSTLEIGIRAVSDTELEKVESRANQVVFENREIRTFFVEAVEAEAVPLRRPPKKQGRIRVVEVSGFDFSACGGTHCCRTGEIGLIKIIRWDRIRNNLRFEFLCGQRAWRDYTEKNRTILEIGQKFSVHERDAARAVDKTIQEVKVSRKKLKQLQEALAGFEARDEVEKGSGWLIKRIWSDKTVEEARLLALNIIRLAERVVLFAVREGERDHFILARSETLPLSMLELVPLVVERSKGKGGGGSSLVEIVAEKGSDLEGILSAAEECLKATLHTLQRK